MKGLCLAALLLLPAACAAVRSSATSAETAEEESRARVTFAYSASLLDGLIVDLSHLRRTLATVSAGHKLHLRLLQAPAHRKPFDEGAAVKEMSHLGPAQMPQVAELMKGMYDSWKDKIGAENKHEHEGKTAYNQEIKLLEAKKDSRGW